MDARWTRIWWVRPVLISTSRRVNLVKRWRTFQIEMALRPWVATIRVLPVDGPSTPDGSDRLADRDELERAFRHLTLEQRAVFVLHHYLGLPLVEIAQLLEIPPGTARSRLHYALAGLREALTAEPEPLVQGGRLA